MEMKKHAILALHMTSKRPKEIVTALNHLGLGRSLVYRSIKRYRETCSVKNRYRGGRKPSRARRVRGFHEEIGSCGESQGRSHRIVMLLRVLQELPTHCIKFGANV